MTKIVNESQQLMNDSKNIGSGDVEATLMASKDILVEKEAVLVLMLRRKSKIIMIGYEKYVNYRFS